MAQRTEVETPANPPARSRPAAETRSAAPPPPSPGKRLLRGVPTARFFSIGVVLVLIVGGSSDGAISKAMRARTTRNGWPLDAAQRAHFRLRLERKCERQPVRQAGTYCRRSIRRIISRARTGPARSGGSARHSAILGINVPIASINTYEPDFFARGRCGKCEAGISAAQQQYDAVKLSSRRSRRTT